MTFISDFPSGIRHGSVVTTYSDEAQKLGAELNAHWQMQASLYPGATFERLFMETAVYLLKNQLAPPSPAPKGLTPVEKRLSLADRQRIVENLTKIINLLVMGFDWSTSIEGETYWRAIHDRLVERAVDFNVSTMPKYPGPVRVGSIRVERGSSVANPIRLTAANQYVQTMCREDALKLAKALTDQAEADEEKGGA